MSDEVAKKQPGKVKTFAELVKFEHSIFALPYAYLGALYGAATVYAVWISNAGVSRAEFVKLAATVPSQGFPGPWRYVTPMGWPGWWALV